MLTGKPGLLLFYPYVEEMSADISDRFRLIKTWEAADPGRMIDERGAEVAAILTTGHDYALNAALCDRLPNLKTALDGGPVLNELFA